MTKRPFRPKIPVAAPYISERAVRYVTDAITSGFVSGIGPYVDRLERGFAAFCGARYGIATSSGTAALHLALAALGIGPGDEVIVPTLTFVATANAVRYLGARPVFVDSETRTWNIDPEGIARATTARTKAIIVVHLYGHPAEMAPILDIATAHGIPVIEDAAEAHGATYHGRRTGALSFAACFSFYGNKLITTGEGGMVTSGDDAFARRVRALRGHAMDPDRQYWHTELGFNYRLASLQAAVGVAQLEEIDEILARKAAQARLYRSLLADGDVELPPSAAGSTSTHWMFSVLVRGESSASLRAALAHEGIETRPFFVPNHLLPHFGGRLGEFPVAEDLARRGVNLPSGVTLDPADVATVAEAVRRNLGTAHQHVSPRPCALRASRAGDRS